MFLLVCLPCCFWCLRSWGIHEFISGAAVLGMICSHILLSVLTGVCPTSICSTSSKGILGNEGPSASHGSCQTTCSSIADASSANTWGWRMIYLGSIQPNDFPEKGTYCPHFTSIVQAIELIAPWCCQKSFTPYFRRAVFLWACRRPFWDNHC